MATDSPKGIVLTGLKVGATTMIADQYKFVKLDGDGNVVISDGTQGEQCIGVLQNKPAIGQACEIIAIGVTKLKTDSTAHAEMGLLTSDGTLGSADLAESGDHVLGVALTTPTASAGVIFTAVVNCIASPVLA